jgi:Tfp pilus assembly protein PilF
MNYGLTRLAARDVPGATANMTLAMQASPHDAMVESGLAQFYNRSSKDKEAEVQYRGAITDGAVWSPAYSLYGEWLLARQRWSEADAMASKAVELDFYDLSGRRTMMEMMTQRHEWSKLQQFATETLRLYPDDLDGARFILVAQTGIDEVARAEKVARVEPSVDNYLALSALYFRTQKYDESIRAARDALKVNPDQWEAYSNIALAYHTLGKVDDAIAALREEIRLKPDFVPAQRNLRYEMAKKEGKADNAR